MIRDTNRQDSIGRAVVAARADRPPIETDEIQDLIDAAGYAVVAECTQVRRADSGTYLGAGKVDELASIVDETAAELVVVDDELTPTQTMRLHDYLPDGTRVVDRYRLVLEIFGDGARHQ